jgi:predicted transcriptional regulator
MARPLADSLSRRERQIMDILHRVPRATAATVRAELPSPPSYSAVRALLRILEDGPRYLYEPVAPRAAERRSAVRHLVRTFFDGSTEEAMAALIDSADRTLNRKQLDELARRIAAARREGR